MIARELAEFDQPVLRMDGTAFEIEGVEEGGPCGIWVDNFGRSEIEMVGKQLSATSHE